MNKNQLKKILRPLIKECIKEVIFEEGTLSSIISEVVKGTSGKQMVQETKKTVFESEPEIKMRRKRKQNQLQENRKKMLDAIGKNAYNGVDLFEGTTPMSAPKSQTSPQGSKPLDGIAPNDPGVDISNFGMASNLWKKLAGN